MMTGSTSELNEQLERVIAERDRYREALEEILCEEDRAWKPVRVFRSEHEAELDDAKHDAWMEAGAIARKALGES